MNFQRYVHGPIPENIPAEHAEWDEEIIKAAGFDPEDEEATLLKTTEEWNGHPAGSLLVMELTVPGHNFAVEIKEG